MSLTIGATNARLVDLGMASNRGDLTDSCVAKAKSSRKCGHPVRVYWRSLLGRPSGICCSCVPEMELVLNSPNGILVSTGEFDKGTSDSERSALEAAASDERKVFAFFCRDSPDESHNAHSAKNGRGSVMRKVAKVSLALTAAFSNRLISAIRSRDFAIATTSVISRIHDWGERFVHRSPFPKPGSDAGHEQYSRVWPSLQVSDRKLDDRSLMIHSAATGPDRISLPAGITANPL